MPNNVNTSDDDITIVWDESEVPTKVFPRPEKDALVRNEKEIAGPRKKPRGKKS